MGSIFSTLRAVLAEAVHAPGATAAAVPPPAAAAPAAAAAAAAALVRHL